MIYLKEQKKDIEARKKMEDLEYQYGVKVLSIFDKGKRFQFFEDVGIWRQGNRKIDKVITSSLTRQFLTKFRNSLNYSIKLVKMRSYRYENYKLVPQLWAETFIYKESLLTQPYRNILSFKNHVIDIEKYVDQFLNFIEKERFTLASNLKKNLSII